jgi:hypothetical protein
MYADFNESPFARSLKSAVAGAFQRAVKGAKSATVRAAPAVVSSQASAETTAAPASTATAPVEPGGDIRPLGGGGMGKWVWIGGAALLALGAAVFLTRKKGKRRRR